jgi:hypothetical protein
MSDRKIITLYIYAKDSDGRYEFPNLIDFPVSSQVTVFKLVSSFQQFLDSFSKGHFLVRSVPFSSDSKQFKFNF